MLLPAAAALLMVVVGLAWRHDREAVEQAASTEVLEAVLAADEDESMYAWLGEAPVAVDPAQGGTL